MKYWKVALLFYLGGMLYTGLELLWRGWSHGSMFLLGGLCFVLIGKLWRTHPLLPVPVRIAAGAGIITMLELGCGLLINRSYDVWDYRNQPLNFHGQICLPFTLLWLPISAVAGLLYGYLDRRLGFWVDFSS